MWLFEKKYSASELSNVAESTETRNILQLYSIGFLIITFASAELSSYSRCSTLKSLTTYFTRSLDFLPWKMRT